MRQRLIALCTASAFFASGCYTLRSDWHEISRRNLWTSNRSVPEGGAAHLRIDQSGDAYRFVVTEQPQCRDAQFGRIELTEQRTQGVNKWPYHLMTYTGLVAWLGFFTPAMYGQLTKKPPWSQDITDVFWGLALAGIVAFTVGLFLKVPYERVKTRTKDGGEASEWDAAPAACGGEQPSPNRAVYLKAAFKNTGRYEYWQRKTDAEGVVALNLMNVGRVAHYCGDATLTISDETPVPSTDDSPGAPFAAVRRFDARSWNVGPSSQATLASLDDVSRTIADECAAKLTNNCASGKRQQFLGDCEQTCAAQQHATQCLIERTDCEAVATGGDERALCPSFFKECLINAGIGLGGFQGCIDKCADDKAQAACRVQ